MLNGMNLKILFHSDGIRFGSNKKLKPFMCFDYVTIYHSKMKGTEFNV